MQPGIKGASKLFEILQGLASPTVLLILCVAALALLAVAILSLRRATVQSHHAAHLEKELALTQLQLTQLEDISAEMFYTYDLEADTLHLSKSCATFLRSPQEVAELRKQFPPVLEAGRLVPRLLAVMGRAQAGEQQLRCQLPAGQEMWVRLSALSIYDDDGDLRYSIGKVAQLVGSHMERQQQMLENAQHDSLTGLLNKKSMELLAGAQLSHKSDQEVHNALMLVDLDYFSETNKTFGGYLSDRLLQQMAELLREIFGPKALLARMQKDEFAIFLAGNGDIGKLTRSCEALRIRLREIQVDGKNLPVSVSIGVVVLTSSTSFHKAYQVAGEALQTVKQNGRDGAGFSEFSELKAAAARPGRERR